MRKYLLVVISVLYHSIIVSQIAKPQFDLKKIEASHDYQANVNALETELKQTHTNSDELLSIQIALINNYVSLSQFDKATALCQKEILDAKKNNLPFHEASLYVALGRVYYFLNQIDKVSIYNNECLKLAEEHQYTELLKKCNHNLGVIAFEKNNDYQLAETYFLKAIEYAKQLPETKQQNLAKNYRLLATTYDMQGRYRLADSIFDITTAIFKKFNDSLGIAEALTFHARVYLSQKKYDKALLLSNESIKIARLQKNDDYLQTALSMLEQILINTERYKEAYTIKNEIFQLATNKYSLTQKKEIADSEAKFKIAELKIKEELAEVKAQQSKQIYLYTFIVLFIVGIAAIIFIYQKRSAKKEATLKLETLKNIYDAEEKERNRIAKDLHDNMGAYTTSILAQIDMLELSNNNIKTEKITELRHDAEHIMSTLRETIWILKSKTITANQLFDIVRIYADKHLVKHVNINVKYNENISNNKTLSPTISLNVYRIIQEVLQNILKHAHATEVIFNLSCNEKITIEIIDNGNGFDLKTQTRSSGLQNMQHRANEIGYTVNLLTEIKKGTQLLIAEK